MNIMTSLSLTYNQYLSKALCHLELFKSFYLDKSRPRLASIAKRRPFKRINPSASF